MCINGRNFPDQSNIFDHFLRMFLKSFPRSTEFYLPPVIRNQFLKMSSTSLPKTQKVVLFEETGASVDVIKYVDWDTPQITSPDDVIVKNKYVGINFIESYFRKGIYPSQKPFIFGREGTGVVAAIGDNVTNFKVGDKVSFLSSPNFTQFTKLQNLVHVLKLPENTTDEELKQHAALLLQGLTALTFIEESYHVEKGDFILVWAAAGGVGQILTQLISNLGGHVIAIASTPEKLNIAKSLGAEYLINSSTDDIVAKVKEITNGAGAIASFDSVGKDTYQISLDSLARKGTFISYGNASGPIPPLPIAQLGALNRKILRPVLNHYITTNQEWDYYSNKLLNFVKSGKLKVNIFNTYPLSDYKKATTDLESRKTTGKLILEVPQ